MFGIRKVDPRFKGFSKDVRWAIFDGMILTAFSDGEFVEEEAGFVLHMGQAMGFSRKEMLRRSKTHTRGARAISQDIKKTIDNARNGNEAASGIFSAMCWVAVMDGKIDEGEINILKQFGEAIFGMSEDDVWKIVEEKLGNR